MKNRRALTVFITYNFCKKYKALTTFSPGIRIKAYLDNMQFAKDDLGARNYNWTDELVFSGDPSRRLFNRYNGNQLLFIINLFASQTEEFTLNTGLQIEEMLLNQLPEDAKSEISVLKWLKENTH